LQSISVSSHLASTRRQEFVAGMKAEIPILLGVIPFGMIYGVLARSAGIPPAAAQAMSAIVFAGSAQLISAQLYGVGAPGLVIVLTASIINLRHTLYSASVQPYLRHLRPMWRWLLAYLLTDEAYAVTIMHYSQYSVEDAHRANTHWFFLGAGLALWSTWQISTAVGIFLGAQLPSRWPLDFAIALTFIALLVPNIQDRASLAAALAGGTAAILSFAMPLKLGLVVGALVGIAAGMWVEAKS
jgi:4-azaleucine resistance transporter AzlC